MELLHHVIFMVIVTLTAAQVHRNPRVKAPTTSIVSPCSDNDECPENLMCIQNKCLDPCGGPCGENARCDVNVSSIVDMRLDSQPQPSCICNPGYVGNPYCGCYTNPVPVPGGCLTSEECCDNLFCMNGRCSDPCKVMGCGPNTQCKASNHTASCVPVIEPTTPTPVKPTVAPIDCTLECAGNDHCPPDRACVNHHCVDPCPGRCGINSPCRVVNHVPSCECLPGHTGNPFESCSHQPGSECLKSWPPVTTKVKKFQTYTMKKVDWLEALMQCRKKGRRLATVMNPQELNDIKATIKNTNIRLESFWIAGTDHLHNQEWSWFTTDGMKLIGQFHDWMNGQPDHDSEDCLEFWERNHEEGYKWNNRACHEQHHFVCEYYE